MPAHIVLVHDDQKFLEEAGMALATAGYDIAAFEKSMTALSALEVAECADVLITRMTFALGNPNGVSLALMARRKRPGIRIVFTATQEMQKYADGLGEFLAAPVNIPDLVGAVRRLLDQRLTERGAQGAQ